MAVGQSPVSLRFCPGFLLLICFGDDGYPYKKALSSTEELNHFVSVCTFGAAPQCLSIVIGICNKELFAVSFVSGFKS